MSSITLKELYEYIQEAAESIAAAADVEVEAKSKSEMDTSLGMLHYVDLTVKLEHGSRVKDLISVMVATVTGVESPIRYGAYTAGNTATLKFWVTPPNLSALLGVLITNDIPYVMGSNGVEYARYGEI